MDQYISVKEVTKKLKIGTSTVWLWVKQGRFPKPVKIANSCTRWLNSDIETFARGEWKEKGNNEE